LETAVASGSAAASAVAVRYEPVSGEEIWVLGAADALSEGRARELAEAARNAPGSFAVSADTQALLDSLLGRWIAAEGATATPAVLLLTARADAESPPSRAIAGRDG
ncbi:MAG: hypothetical protein ACREUG_04285, partial [Steroidobacteraceae bacterium]